MTHRIAPLILTLALAGPAWSQQDPAPVPPHSETEAPEAEAPGAIERGLGALIDRLFAEEEATPDTADPGATDPAAPDPEAADPGPVLPDAEGLAQGLTGALRQMGPVLRDLAVQVDDFRNYEAPERLPNGDILIRRSPGAPPPPPLGETLDPDTDPATAPAAPAIAL